MAGVWLNGPGNKATCKMAVAIAMAESTGDTHAVNVNTDQWHSRDRGLWQINDHFHPDCTDQCAFDPTCNAQCAFKISNGGTDFSLWSTFRKNMYQKFLDLAGQGCGV